MRLTIQPFDVPPRPALIREWLDQLGSDEMLLYASDYPHVHAGDAESTLLQHLPVALANKIRHGNAQAFYKL
jgi:predicted TIM-barrel fold metal-dependent hydrolase